MLSKHKWLPGLAAATAKANTKTADGKLLSIKRVAVAWPHNPDIQSPPFASLQMRVSGVVNGVH